MFVFIFISVWVFLSFVCSHHHSICRFNLLIMKSRTEHFFFRLCRHDNGSECFFKLTMVWTAFAFFDSSKSNSWKWFFFLYICSFFGLRANKKTFISRFICAISFSLIFQSLNVLHAYCYLIFPIRNSESQKINNFCFRRLAIVTGIKSHHCFPFRGCARSV